jgi:hypothetical protein
MTTAAASGFGAMISSLTSSYAMPCFVRPSFEFWPLMIRSG